MPTDPSDAAAALARLAEAFRSTPFIAHMGLEDVHLVQGGAVSARMPLRPEHERAAGSKQFHGGPIASFIDTVGDLAVAVIAGGGVPTINIRIDYLKPTVGAYVEAVARVRRSGRTVTIADIDVFDEKGSLVAIGRGTYSSQAG